MCKIGLYFMCGFPTEDVFFNAIRLAQQYNIDFIELGFAFSDPIADGNIIEKASFEMLKKYNLDDFFDMFQRVRNIYNGKLYIMTYTNIVYSYGIENFVERTRGLDGIILADLPFIERNRFEPIFKKYSIALIRFITPENSYSDIDKIMKDAEGFIYFVSMRGTTGSEFSLDEQTQQKIRYACNNSHLDVILGFGIKEKRDIYKACEFANGVVIGTKVIESLNNNGFKKFLDSIMY